MSTQAYKVNIKKVIYFYKLLLNNYLHFWPAGDPLICVCSSSSLSSGRPNEGGVCAVGVVAVGVAPRVDEVVVSSSVDHSWFGFEVAFTGRGSR